jgi:uncharacterized protein
MLHNRPQFKCLARLYDAERPTMNNRLLALLPSAVALLAVVASGCGGNHSTLPPCQLSDPTGPLPQGPTSPPCSPSPDPGQSGSERDTGYAADVHRVLLVGLAENVILPTYRDFRTRATALVAAATAYKASLSEADLMTLREAWRQAMQVWQHAEVLQVGPAGSMTTALGGEDRRSEIYSWPTVNACRVDQELTEDAHSDAGTLGSEMVNTRGLDAMEYLLFGDLELNECKSQSAINAEGTWQALVDAGELPARRAAYLHSISVLVAQEAESLVDVWEDDETGFLAELSEAGVSSEVYASAQHALNAISDAMFYVEKQTKDMKLAHPAGISTCEEATCPDALESRWAHHSRENVLANVQALQWLFHGGPDAETALGFDDVLTEMGASALATDFGTNLSMAVNALSSMDMSFVEALSSDPQAVIDIYDVVKGATDLLKTEFVGTLDLEIPNRAAGDND